jgi:phosphoribosylamine--glycine ligase
MNILVIGSGGREHALSWKIAQGKGLNKLYIAPGNAGTAKLGMNVDIGVNDFEKMGNFVLENDVNMVIVGPEEPLVKGIREYFEADANLQGIPVIGPTSKGAMLEGSKDFAKNFMARYNIPTAMYKSFSFEQQDEAQEYLKRIRPPYVLKADGLAAGKGVVISDDYESAATELLDMFGGKFGTAGHTVVIEEFLKGIEVSVFVLTDGESYKILPEAKDYKRVGEKDTGLNTGGMGAVSPVPFADKKFMAKIEQQIIKPTIEGLKKENIDYKGFIFFGLMNMDGSPYVIEYNVRMGDPEAEVVLPRVQTDMLELLEAVAKKQLESMPLDIDPRAAATVMKVSGGYPGKYQKGIAMEFDENINDCILFHAGTKPEGQKVLTNGGRVLAVSALGKDIWEALEKTYAQVDKIRFENSYYRKDIGFDLK